MGNRFAQRFRQIKIQLGRVLFLSQIKVQYNRRKPSSMNLSRQATV